MFCPNCGGQVDNGAQFCPNCGTTLNADAPAPGVTPAGEQNSYNQQDNYDQQNSYNQQESYNQQNNYNQQESYAPVGTGTERNIVLCIVLSIVTCGIYGIYWMCKLNEEINSLSGQEGLSGILVVLLSIVTCGIYGLIWYYRMGQRVDIIKDQEGSSHILFLVLGLFGLGIVNFGLMQDAINKAVQM